MTTGVDYFGPMKTIHKGFCIAKLENIMKDWLVESYLVMKSTPIFPGGRPLLDIEYKYNSRKVRGFIATEGAGSNETCSSPRRAVRSHSLVCSENPFSIVGIGPIPVKEL